MDDPPRLRRGIVTWAGLIAFWLALGLWACLGGCSGPAQQLKADCVGSGGTFIARRGTVTTEGGEYPAVMFLCVFNGKTA